MAFGFRVAEVERAAQGLKRIIIGLLKLRQGAAELGRALLDEFLQIPLVIPVLKNQPAMLQGAAHAHEELILFKRLQDVVVSTAPDRFQGCGNVVNRRDHNHRDFVVRDAEPVQELDAVHLGHDHVAQDQVGPKFAKLILG